VGGGSRIRQAAGRLEPALPGAAGGRGDELDRAVVEAVEAVADQAGQVLVAGEEQRPGPLDQLQGGAVRRAATAASASESNWARPRSSVWTRWTRLTQAAGAM
jgi:hypothetical protein